MLNVVGGMDTIRTRISVDPVTGSETLLKTSAGLARFMTTQKEREEEVVTFRTFVFATFAAPTAARVANRNGGALKTVKKLISANKDVAYFVHPYRTDKTVRWGDVMRIDGTQALVNGKTKTPSTVGKILTAAYPGLPYRFENPGGTTLPNGRSPVFIASTEVEYAYGAGYTFKPTIAVVGTDGVATEVLTISTTDALWFADSATGVRCDKDGVYSFAWLVDARPSLTTVYSEVATALGAAPSETLRLVQNETMLPPSLAVSAPGPSNSKDLNVVGTYLGNYLQELVYPPPWGWIDDSWRAWAIRRYYSGTTFNAYVPITKTTTNRNISGGVSKKTIYANTGYAIDYEMVFSGGESEVYETPQFNQDAEVYQLAIGGSKLTLNSSSSSIMKALFVAPVCSVNTLYSAEVTTTSNFYYKFGESLASVTWDYSPVGIPYVGPAGDQWVELKIDTDPPYNPVSKSVIEDSIAAHNQWAIQNEEEVLKINGPWDGPIRTIVMDGAPVHSRSDTRNLLVRANDFVYADPDEGIAVYMRSTLTVALAYSKTANPELGETIPGFMENDLNWNSINSHLLIEFVIQHRGGQHVITHYNAQTHLPEISCGFAYNPGDEGDMTKWFTCIHVPGETTPVFNPIYMSQGKCPWIAYTTIDEEAGIGTSPPATPELYVDMRLKPRPAGTMDVAENHYGPALYSDVTTFTAHQLASLVRNYLAHNAPTDYWDTVLFPSPVSVRFAFGISGPWVNSIGSPFSDSDHVSISRI